MRVKLLANNKIINRTKTLVGTKYNIIYIHFHYFVFLILMANT